MKKKLLCIFLSILGFGFVYSQEYSSSDLVYNTQILDEFSIQPNPSSTEIRVILPKNTLKIRIISLTGKVVYEQDIRQDEGFQIIDVSPLSRGTYFLRIEGPDSIHTKKLIRGS